jgi:hypothetical protein
MRLRRSRDQAPMITDGKLALLYLVIVGMITVLYVDDESVNRIKRLITGSTVPLVQTTAE